MATALELSRQEWQPYIQRARQARQNGPRLTPEQEKQREQLLRLVSQAAQLLKSQFGAEKVFLFGSLAHRSWFERHSDVDIAVLGLPQTNYWQAWKMVEDMIKDRPVDLVQIEEASPSLLRVIERDGIEL